MPTDLTLRRPIRPGLVDTLAVLIAAIVVTSVFSWIQGVVVLLAGAAVALYRPRVTLTATGLRIGRREVPWLDVSAIEDVRGLRSRYVRVFVRTQDKWVRVPALRTSRTFPSTWYTDAFGQVSRFVTDHVPTARVGTEHKFHAGLYPAVAAVLLAVAVYTQHPVQYWLPVPLAAQVPDSCDVHPPADQSWQARAVESPAEDGTMACRHESVYWHLTTQVKVYGRSGPLNGAGAAHQAYRHLSVYVGNATSDDPPPTLLLPPAADEASVDIGGWPGAHVVARRANVVVIVIYRPAHPATTFQEPVASDTTEAQEIAKSLLDRVTIG